MRSRVSTTLVVQALHRYYALSQRLPLGDPQCHCYPNRSIQQCDEECFENVQKNSKHTWLRYRSAFLDTGISGQCRKRMESVQHGGETSLYRVSSECIPRTDCNGGNISRQSSVCSAIGWTQRDDGLEYVRTCISSILSRVLRPP